MQKWKHRTTYLLLLFFWLSTAACEAEHKRPANIYVPNGYVGWVRIEYGVEGARELEADFFDRLEYQRFPPSGLLQTSTPLKQGVATAYYFYYSGDELSHEMINGGLISWCVKKPDGSRLEREFQTYFVGPKQAYEKHKHELERIKKGDCDYVINSLAELPPVGNRSRGN